MVEIKRVKRWQALDIGIVHKSPEKLLVSAILYRALADTREEGQENLKESKDHARREAFQWFNDSDNIEPFSFNWCCEILGLCDKKRILDRVRDGVKLKGMGCGNAGRKKLHAPHIKSRDF